MQVYMHANTELYYVTMCYMKRRLHYCQTVWVSIDDAQAWCTTF